MMMKNRHDQHWIEHGQRTLKKLLEELRSLDVLPTPQAAGMEPATYMCAANLDALMVTYDDDDLVADIAFRNVPDGCPELLGIVRADPGSDFVAVREIGISLILDVLYGDIVPADVRLLNDGETAAVDAVDSAPVGNVKEQASEEARKFFVTRDGNRYEVVRKYMQRPLSQNELQRLKDVEEAAVGRREQQSKPAILTDAEIEAANMAAFYCALAGAGITGIIGYHDCYEEDGSTFEGIRAICEQKLMELPSLDVQWASKDAQGRQGETFQKGVRAVLHDIVDDILSGIQEGYGFARGTLFKFRCDVTTRKFHIKAKGYDLNNAFRELDLMC